MGIQSLILKSWGQDKSRSLIQLFHGTFAIGAFIAPLICQICIKEESVNEVLPASCPIDNNRTNEFNVNGNNTAVIDQYGLSISYLICGISGKLLCL